MNFFIGLFLFLDWAASLHFGAVEGKKPHANAQRRHLSLAKILPGSSWPGLSIPVRHCATEKGKPDSGIAEARNDVVDGARSRQRGALG